MTVSQWEILVEEASAEAFLSACLPKILGNEAIVNIHVHQGKSDLLRKLESRLRSYAKWLPEDARIVVLVDRDASDCKALKAQMERAAFNAGLRARLRKGYRG